MQLPRFDISIVEGQDFSQEFKIKNPDGTYKILTGYTVESEIRTDFDEQAVLIKPLSHTIDEDTLTLSLSHSDTLDLAPPVNPNSARSTIGYYDVFLTSPVDGKRKYFVGGRVGYTQTITKVVI